MLHEYKVMIAPTSSVEDADPPLPPRTLLVDIMGYPDAGWTGTLLDPQAHASAQPGEVMVTIVEGDQAKKYAVAQFNPHDNGPELTGKTGFTRATGA